MHKIRMDYLVENLDRLQSSENDGRGVSCIRGTIASLKSGDYEGAQQGIKIEWDKIRNYPSIARFIKREIFPTEKHLSYFDESGEWVE